MAARTAKVKGTLPPEMVAAAAANKAAHAHLVQMIEDNKEALQRAVRKLLTPRVNIVHESQTNSQAR